MDVTVHLNDPPLRAFLAEFLGPNKTGAQVPGIGPTTYTSSDPTVATVDPITGNLVYVKEGQTQVKGLNAGNQLSDIGTLTIISGVAQSADLQFLAQLNGGGAGAPTLTTQPQAASASISAAAPGNTATFSVVPGGVGPFQFQWFANGVAIPGATAISFTTAAVTAAMNGTAYTCKVANAAGSILSQAALLTVTP